MTTDFIFHTVQNSRIDSVNLRDLPFGSVFSDHQFQMNFKNGEWQQGEISPYGDMSLSPAAMALHYGQAIFEGHEGVSPARWFSGAFPPHGKHSALQQKRGAYVHGTGGRRRVFECPD